jgi:hypothetical protein
MESGAILADNSVAKSKGAADHNPSFVEVEQVKKFDWLLLEHLKSTF